MTCLCSLQLGSLLGSLPNIPSTIGLVPAFPLSLTAAVNASLMPMSLAANLSAGATANASLVANLALMASLTAAVNASLGVNLALPLSVSAMASLHANLAANIHSLNGSGHLFNLWGPSLADLLRMLAGLMPLIGLMVSIRAAFGIDLRLPGAIVALQARLSASARLALGASLSAKASLSVVETLMLSMGFALTAQGALALNGSMSALSRLTLGLPSITVNFGALAWLAALMALLAAIKLHLGVDLRAPNALINLKLALGALPLSALANLNVAATASAAASATATASATAGLNLAAAAHANLSAAARLAVLMQLTANASFLLMPPGTCGMPCPIALVAAL